MHWKAILSQQFKVDGPKALLYLSELDHQVTIHDFQSPSYKCMPKVSKDILQKVIDQQYKEAKCALQDLLGRSRPGHTTHVIKTFI